MATTFYRLDQLSNPDDQPQDKSHGRWTQQEHQKFIDGLKAFGKNWKKVEEYIKTRTGAQIRSHAQKFFNRIEKLDKEKQKKQQILEKEGIKPYDGMDQNNKEQSENSTLIAINNKKKKALKKNQQAEQKEITEKVEEQDYPNQGQTTVSNQYSSDNINDKHLPNSQIPNSAQNLIYLASQLGQQSQVPSQTQQLAQQQQQQLQSEPLFQQQQQSQQQLMQQQYDLFRFNQQQQSYYPSNCFQQLGQYYQPSLYYDYNYQMNQYPYQYPLDYTQSFIPQNGTSFYYDPYLGINQNPQFYQAQSQPQAEVEETITKKRKL